MQVVQQETGGHAHSDRKHKKGEGDTEKFLLNIC